MTTSPLDDTDLTTEEAVRRAAWQEALHLYDTWDATRRRAEGGPGGGGYRDPYAADSERSLRTRLDAIVAEHGFANTRVDPLGLSWVERRSASYDCPPTDDTPCTHDSNTCDVHWGRRHAQMPSYDCGFRAEVAQ